MRAYMVEYLLLLLEKCFDNSEKIGKSLVYKQKNLFLF